jgi:hypothetical protein
MSFDYERQMIEPVEMWLLSQGLLVKREFPLPWGICDLVGCSFNKKSVKKRLAFGQKKTVGSHLRVALLSMIPDREEARSISVEKLHGAFAGFVDESQIRIELERLERDKFVVQTPEGAFQRVNGWLPLHRRLVAVELKLTRVDDALHQAINNLGFADESYVGLPADVAKRLINSKRKSQFADSRVGVIAVDSARCKILLKPNLGKASGDEVIQMHCVERFWRSYLIDTEA